MAPRKSFSGTTQKLVLGIDVGTTYAGMSYCLLQPGKIPSILPITRFPPQDHIGGDSKVRSVVYYDPAGRAKALGAEAMQESVIEQAEEGGWEKTEWFKLHMRPASSTIRPNSLPPLPTNKTSADVFADFLRYLFSCAKTYIADHYPNGNALWIALQDSIEFVLTHPNGWEGEQQALMRRATVIAGLVPNESKGHERVHFVTEGEASLHFCILNGLAADPLKQGKGVMIVDAGGGTIDISTYRKVTRPKGESFEEIAPAKCLFQGSIFVSDRAKEYLTTILKGSKYADDVDHIRDCFDKTTKLKFRSADDWSYIKFGRPRDKDDALNIANGQMKIAGCVNVVAGFFQPSLEAIIRTVNFQCRTSDIPISCILLVGGFAASEWLYSELKKRLSPIGLEVSRPDSHVNKAVSDGAVSFYLDRFVTARIAKDTYGIECGVKYNPSDAEHASRSKSTYMDESGDLRVFEKFSSILLKNVRVSETKEFRKSYSVLKGAVSQLSAVDINILRYRGVCKDPQWLDIDPDNYGVLCTVRADTSKIAKTLKPRHGQRGVYYDLQIDVVLSFGLTELKAQIAWVENV
ncbi:hypothetical protein GGX14DRAFT_609817, partial [Mycena pura]